MMDLLKCTPEQWYQQESNYSQLLQDADLNKIPLLNVEELHNLSDARLVRFRCMIQDMRGPEFYLEKFDAVNSETRQTRTGFGKYVDIAPCQPDEIIDADGPSVVRGERQTYVAISVPAMNSWAVEIEKNNEVISINTSQTSSSSVGKRNLDAMEEEPIEGNVDLNKRQCIQSEIKSEAPCLVSQEHLLNFPIPDSSGKVCIIKVYTNSEQLKLNCMYEFIGFLSVDPTLSSHTDEEMNDVEFQVHNPPPSIIPRIHCVSFKTLLHNNPLVSTTKLGCEKMQFLKKELLILLTQLLCGDELAAEYFIYYLISEVYLRKDLMVIGKFSLNISNVPNFGDLDYVRELYKFIEILVTKSHYLAMSLENMNELAFIPKKDYTSNRLTSSILQLSANTHLVIDETKLCAGKLNEAGVIGVKALAKTIKNQKILYDFTYYQMEFDCDIPCLVFSEGKSMLPSDAHVILESDDLHLKTFNEILPAARHFLKPELLNDLRIYLTTARLTEYELSDGVQDLVQNEYVTMRQKGDCSGEDLHNLLVLARLVCISQGKNTLDEESWKKACGLEEKRKNRIKNRT